MKRHYAVSPTSVLIRVFLQDSSVTTGAGRTGLANNTSGLKIAIIKDGASSATVYTAAGSTIETITTLGTYQAPSSNCCRFREVSSTDMPGIYEIHFADAALASTTGVIAQIYGASNLAPCSVELTMGNLSAVAQSVVDKTGYTVSTVEDKSGYALTSAYDAAKTAATQTSVDAIAANLLRGLGLMMENHVEDDIIRNSDGNKTASKFYLYDSRTNALTHNGSTGLIATYSVSISYDANKNISLFKIVKDD